MVRFERPTHQAGAIWRRWLLVAMVSTMATMPEIATAQGEGQDTPENKAADKKSTPAAAKENPAAPVREKNDPPSKDEKAPPAKAPGKAATEPGKAPSAPETGAPKDASTMKKGTYTVRLRDLEDRINRLKEQIFRSKARLSLLAETVLDRKIAGSKAVISFRNEMGGSFRLVKATFLLDGAPVFSQSDEAGNLAERDVINLFDGPVMPGEHTLSVVLKYRGHGYGIFSYLRGYSFKTRSSRSFSIHEGKALSVEVVGYEKGGVTTPLEDRPDIRYIMSVAEYEPGALETNRKE